jgi:hypothetical protein
MTRLLLIILLFLSSAPAYAEWVKIGDQDQARMTVYVDRDTIHRKGELVKMWHLDDFKTVQTVEDNSYLSIKTQQEYDCPKDRFRALVFMWFSDNMGLGTVIYSVSYEQSWEPVHPDSVGQDLWKVACSKQ